MRYFPVHSEKKTPLFKDWQMLASSEQAARSSWSTAYPGCRFGRLTGEKEGFFVLDVDNKTADGYASLAEFGIEPDGDNVVPTPSGGVHIYYQWPKGMAIPQKVGFRPGLDTRANGGYVVAYDLASKGTAPVLRMPPDALLAALVTPEPKNVTKPAAKESSGVVGEGGRNHYLAQCAGRLHRAGLLTFEALMSVNERDCVPPLDEAEVNLICDSILRYASQDPVVPAQEGLLWASSFLKTMMDYLMDKDLVKGEPTGLEAMDRLLGGGKRLGELDVTLAEAKTGKNTLWHQLLVHWLDKGIPVAYASRELSPDTEVLPNLLTVAFKNNMLDAKTYDEEAIRKALDRWKLVFSPGYGAYPPEELIPWMDQCRQAGVQYFFIDHLHYCLDDPEDFKLISVFIRKLKAYCKENQVHVDLIVQPKVLQAGDRLTLNSMRGGASIGQALDNLWTLMRVKDETGRKTNVVEVCLEAARSKLASLGSFYLEYNKETMTFREVVPVEETADTKALGD